MTLKDSSAFSPSSVVRGSESHKMIDLSGNRVLRIYYTSRVSISCPSLTPSAPSPGRCPGPRGGEPCQPRWGWGGPGNCPGSRWFLKKEVMSSGYSLFLPANHPLFPRYNFSSPSSEGLPPFLCVLGVGRLAHGPTLLLKQPFCSSCSLLCLPCVLEMNSSTASSTCSVSPRDL